MGTFAPEEDDTFYFTARSPACKQVMVDCIWLEKVPADNAAAQ